MLILYTAGCKCQIFLDSLECFAADISDNVDMATILPNLISHGLLTPEQQECLNHPMLTPTKKQQELCGILLRLNEDRVKKFLQCLSETSSYDPHKQLLNKICCKCIYCFHVTEILNLIFST